MEFHEYMQSILELESRLEKAVQKASGNKGALLGPLAAMRDPEVQDLQRQMAMVKTQFFGSEHAQR